MNKKMTLLDKAISYFSPTLAVKRFKAKSLLSGYTGSNTKRSLKNWSPQNLDVNDVYNSFSLNALRGRSQDLFRSNTIASGAIKTNKTNVIGTGLKLQARINREFLNLSDDEADKLEEKVENLFSIWCSQCDAAETNNFYTFQDLAYLTYLLEGDSFVTFPLIKRVNDYTDFKIQLYSGSRVSTPPEKSESDNLKNGIEYDKFGAPTYYHFRKSANLGSYNYNNFTRIQKVLRNGKVNVLHIFKQDSPGQSRGVPYLSPIIESLKNLGRYSESELTAAVVSSLFTVFVKSESGDPDDTFGDDEKEKYEDINYSLGPGAVIGLAPDENIETSNPTRPNTAFGDFVRSYLEQIGMALQIPYELLTKHFQASYSAARAALLEAWKDFKVWRTWFAAKFCQPIYEGWFRWMVLTGYIDAPGFFDSPLIRGAYTRAVWVGPSPGQIDPSKEVKAALDKVDNTLSTKSKEVASLTGEDYETVLKQRAKEKKLEQKYLNFYSDKKEDKNEELKD